MSKADAFTVPIQLTFNKSTTYQSALSGFFSILIYATSILYAIHILLQWSQGDLLPKSSTTTGTLQTLQVQFEKGFFELGIMNSSLSQNPFAQENNLLLPLLFKFQNGQSTLIGPIFSNSTSGYLNLDSLTLSYNQETDDEVQYFFIITSCTAKYIQSYGTCASKDKVDTYIENISSLIDLKIKIKQFNPKTQKYDTITKRQLLAFERKYVFYSQLSFQVTKVQTNDGLLLDDLHDYTYINNYEISNQIVSANFSNQYEGTQTLGFFYLRLDSLQVSQNIQYPKIGEVFASIGSIIQVLFMASYLFKFINQQLFEYEFVETLLSIYYEQWKNIKQSGLIPFYPDKIELNDKQIDGKIYKKFRQKAQDQMINKLDLINLINHIIKIEQLLIDISSKEQLNNIVNKKLSINFMKQDDYDKCQIIPINDEIQSASHSITNLNNLPQFFTFDELITLFDYQ
ncbi:hypothetical protein pb186bvf_006564 [Paramecium bursaria]